MRPLKIIIISILVIVTLVAGAFIFYKSANADKTAPVIKFTDDTVSTYNEGDDKKTLLKGVIATDDRDGDVTNKIIVQSITPILSSEKATIVYAVSDNSYNIATDERTVIYVAKHDGASTVEENSVPVIILNSKLIEVPVNSVFNPLDCIKQIDDDKDIGLIDKVFYTTNLDISKVGSYNIAFVVIDSDNNKSEFTEMRIIVVNPTE